MLSKQALIVVRAKADKHTGPRALQLRGRHSGVLSRAPGGFEKEAVLGIQSDRIARGDPEEIRIEVVNMRHEAAPPRDQAAERAGLLVGEPVAGNFGNDIGAFTK